MLLTQLNVWLDVVFTALYAAILVGLFVWSPGTTSIAPRVSGGDDAMRSARLTVISPLGFLQTAPSRLEWLEIKGAVKYQVKLSEVDHTQIWSATVDSPGIALPADVLAKIVPRKTFTWQVTALDQNGAIIAESGSQRFKMEQPPNQ